MQCSNCEESALYQYSPKGAAPTAFCAPHLPSFLRNAAKAGLLETTEHYESLRVSAFASLSPEATPEQEIEPAPEPPTRKKRTRKKPVPEAVEEIPVETVVEDESVDAAGTEFGEE